MDDKKPTTLWTKLEKMVKNLFSDPILGPQFFFANFSSTRCEALLQAIILCNFQENVWSKLKKMAKTLLWVWFGPPVFFFKNLAASITKYHLSSCTISEKTNGPILRKFSDGRTDGQIESDGQTGIWTDEREWVHRTLSD